ncbi:manganese efflux pump [uncultured Faecalibaculum sp.]|uniref:manganese efflux pump MntP n=1 Tax=uncultured Faecalibaculum sp. TaxID=1729681 RepID=UPI0025DAA67F|nr:manganese efflux pump [uncultured Faecalibaculum sp.]
MTGLVITSILLGTGLAMDAFSVSLADGLNEPRMKSARMCFISGLFGFFQFAMPLAGWFCVHSIAQLFAGFKPFIPWISLILLLWIGIDMIREAGNRQKPAVSFAALVLQGIATSIDALSVGFTISRYQWHEALISCLIIGIVTWIICLAGLWIGKRFGMRFARQAGLAGGTILILIGLEIFIKSFF